MRRTPALLLAALLVTTVSTATDAQEKKGEDVIIPSELELDDEQKAELQKLVTKELQGALSKCVGTYPRPEFFTTVFAEYRLKKSGQLNGGYIGGNAPDSNMYVKSDEERAKLEEEGSFARMVIRADKAVERCMKKNTGNADSGLDRYAAQIKAGFDVKWSGKTPKLSATQFDIEKKK